MKKAVTYDLKDIMDTVSMVIKHINKMNYMPNVGRNELYNDLCGGICSGVKDIVVYCNKHKIIVEKPETLKLMVFAIPYLNTPSFNLKDYLKSIFALIIEAYKNKFDFSDNLEKTVKICESLIQDKTSVGYMVVYGYIKGFQECMKDIGNHSNSN